VIVGVPIGSLGDVLESVVVELAEEGAVPLVTEVPLAHVSLEEDWEVDPESPPVREPRDPLPVLIPLGQDVVHLLRKRHVLDPLRAAIVAFFGGNSGKISVGVIHVVSRLGYDLDRLRLDRIIKALLPRPPSFRIAIIGKIVVAIACSSRLCYHFALVGVRVDRGSLSFASFAFTPRITGSSRSLAGWCIGTRGVKAC